MFHFTENQVVQHPGSSIEQRWSFAELLGAFDPLSGEPIAERNAAMLRAVEQISREPVELSEAARLHLDFWKNFRPGKISEHTFIYEADYPFELTINSLGLFFKDVSGHYYYPPGSVREQLFSDFWFYGPARPMPDLNLRNRVVGIIKSAFADAGCPAAQAHFELFAYPVEAPTGLSWEEGDHIRRDFVNVRRFGIEMGYMTWRDSEPGQGYLSFEHFLHVPPPHYGWITPEMRVAIENYIGKTSVFSVPRPAPEPPPPPSPREKMDRSEALLRQQPNSEEGANLLISLLEYEAETDYWRNYVFNRCMHLRENPAVQQFIAERLQGDNEIHFRKAVDVLMGWGIYGDKNLTDRNLLLALNWADATANDPDFRQALAKAIRIIFQQ
jgi:hypothetical protein